MDFKVLITDSALLDLQEIVQFVAQDDPAAAARLGLKLVRHAMNLATMPERHAYYDKEREIRKVPAAPYLVFYTCDEFAGVVNILHFWHGARREPDFGR